MKIIIIGDGSLKMAETVNLTFPNSQLLTDKNFNNIMTSNGCFYTSIADLSTTNFLEALQIADEIIYQDPIVWEDKICKSNTLTLLAQCNKPIKNFNDKNVNDVFGLLKLTTGRVSNTRQLWVAGCSISHGTGVTKEQRFGQLVADNIDLPVSFLTCPGSSIQWAADQILRSDIRSGEIVLWGLPNVERFISFKNKIKANFNVGSFNDNKLALVNTLSSGETNSYVLDTYISTTRSMELLTPTEQDAMKRDLVSDDRILIAVLSIFQVINYCKQIGAKLVISPLVRPFDNTVLLYITELDNYINLTDLHDFAEDKCHPGISTHNAWHIEIINFIRGKNWV